MKVVRKSEQSAYEQAQAQHEKLLEGHAAHVAQIEAENDVAKESHKAYKAEVVEANAAAKDAYVEAEKQREQAVEAHEQSVQALADFEKQQGERGTVRKAADKMLGGPSPPPVLEPPAELPPPPAEIEVSELVLTEPPVEPGFPTPPPATYTAEEVPEDAAPKKIKTKFGEALAMPGMLVVTDDETGDTIVVHPSDFERKFLEVK